MKRTTIHPRSVKYMLGAKNQIPISNKTEATVHVTEVVAGSPGEMKKTNLCQACFSQSELSKNANLKKAGWTSYGPTKTFQPDDEPGR